MAFDKGHIRHSASFALERNTVEMISRAPLCSLVLEIEWSMQLAKINARDLASKRIFNLKDRENAPINLDNLKMRTATESRFGVSGGV